MNPDETNGVVPLVEFYRTFSMNLRTDLQNAASCGIVTELLEWRISQRQAAEQLGIARSTLNAFLNCEYGKQHRKTLEKLLAASIWSPPTREALQKLLDYEKLAFHGVSKRPVLLVFDGGREK